MTAPASYAEPTYLVLAGLVVLVAIFLMALAWVVLSIRASTRRHNEAARRRLRALKAGPDRRAEERAAVLARMEEIRRDTAAGIISPMRPYERKVRA